VSVARQDSFLVTESRVAQVHVHVDQASRDDQPTRVNLFNFGFRTSNFGLGPDDFSISDVNIGNSIPLVCGIDHATVADDGRAHVRGANACSVLVAASCGDELLSDIAAMSDCCPDAKVRDRKMRSPALKMSAPPRRAIASVLTSRFLHTNIKQPCARRDRW